MAAAQQNLNGNTIRLPNRVDAVEKVLRLAPNSDSADSEGHGLGGSDDGSAEGDQASLFYEFRLDDRIPKDHLLRRIDGFVTAALADVHERLEPYYSEIGRPSGSIAAGPAKAAELRRGGEWKTTPSTMRQSTCGR